MGDCEIEFPGPLQNHNIGGARAQIRIFVMPNTRLNNGILSYWIMEKEHPPGQAVSWQLWVPRQ